MRYLLRSDLPPLPAYYKIEQPQRDGSRYWKFLSYEWAIQVVLYKGPLMGKGWQNQVGITRIKVATIVGNYSFRKEFQASSRMEFQAAWANVLKELQKK